MALDLKKKIIGGFGLLLLVFALGGLLSILNLREQRGVVNEVVTHDVPMVEELGRSSELLQLYRKAEKDVLLTIGDAKRQQAYFAKLQSLDQETRKSLTALDKATQADEDIEPSVRKIPAQALADFDSYDKVVQGLCAKLTADPTGKLMSPQEANTLLSKEKDSVHRIEKGLVELNKAAGSMLNGNQHALAALAAKTETTLQLTVLLAMLAGLALGVLTLFSITRPLARIMDFAGAVAKGDLNASVSGTFTAEMAQLRESIAAMLLALKAKIAEADTKTAEAAEEARRAKVATDEANAAKAQAERAQAEGMLQAAVQLERVVEIISSASEELSAQVEQSSRGTEVQSQRVAETATAMEEMNATVLEVARNASQAADSSASARAKAVDGATVVAQVVQGIGTVQAVSLAMKEDMGVLGRQAEGIGAVMNVISDIADQTNLLALNAAIEAARAGDAGRGFAVVADEVRKLAEKTMAATREVGEAISGIQSGTRKNLENVDRAAVSIEQATGLAGKSGEALQEIVRLVEVSADQVRSIATASEEQSAASEEINRSIEDISRISSETASAMGQSAQAVGELASQAQALRALIEKLKSGG